MKNKIIYIFFAISLVTGLIAILSAVLDIKLLRLWKEFYILLLLLLGIPELKKVDSKFWIITFSFFLFWFIEFWYSFHFLEIPLNVLLYQFKLDGFVFLFGLSIYLLRENINLKVIAKILIVFGILNAFIILLQHFFQESYFSLFKVTYANPGENFGIKIVTSDGTVRSPGLLTGFVQSGTLMFFCIVTLIETKLIKNKLLHYSTLLLFIISLFFTTYKTGVLGLLFFLALKLIEKFNKKYTWGFVILSFLSMLFLTNSLVLYKYIEKINHYMAYNSIFVRVDQHGTILNQFTSFSHYILGLGLGTNGTFGLEKNMNSLPTDSTYIYLLSNYGFIFLLVFITVLLFVIYNLFYKVEDKIGIKYIILYTLVVEFFFNNAITNFPVTLFIVAITIVTLNEKKSG